jgi:tetratricopeptide (TPR) repeat protein
MKKWYLALAAIVVAVYGQTLFFSLLWWDDRKHLCLNPAFNPLNPQSFIEMWEKPYFGLYAPLAYTAWSLPVFIMQKLGWTCDQGAGLFHALNLILHLGTTLVVFALLKKLFPRENPLVAFMASALFALHPLQVEAVSWVSATRDLLAAFLGFSAMLLLLKERWKSALVLILLSFLAKATTVVFPVLALVLMRIRDQKVSKKSWRFFGLSALGAVMISWITKSLQADELLRFSSVWWERPLLFAQALGFYLTKFVIPTQLAPDYGRSVVALRENPLLFWPISVAAVFTAAAFYARPLFKSSVLWLVAALLPVSGLVSFGFQEISTVADRYMYIPIFAFSMAAMEWHRNKPVKRIEIIGGAAILTLLALFSFRQTTYWKNDETLFTHNAEVLPSSVVVYGNLGNFYLKNGSLDQAEGAFRHAIENRQSDKEGWLGLARTLERKGQVNEAQSVYQQAIEANSASPEIFNNLAVIFYGQKNFDEAEKNWRKAADADSAYMEPRYNLAELALMRSEPQQALEYFRQAQAIAPRDERIRNEIERVQKLIH